MDKRTILTTAALAALTLAAGCAGAKQASGGMGNKAQAPAKGECYGVNSCKGQGACGGPGHSCAGQNSCKGQGWLSLSKADCDAQGGKYKAQ